MALLYVMFAQALSGIAKDLNKMSANASVKTLVPADANARLFKWVAILTGSKNALKGASFFLGAALLQLAGFRNALLILAGGLLLVLLTTLLLLPRELGKAKSKPKFSQVFSNTPAINWLSAARFFLFGARKVGFYYMANAGGRLAGTALSGWSYQQFGLEGCLWLSAGFVFAALLLSLRLPAGAEHAT